MVSLLTFRWGALLVLALAFFLAFGVGCGASSTGEKSSVKGAASPSSISVGYTEGNHIVPFSVRLRDGSLLTSDELLNLGQPTFMIFFKPNCSVCFAEMGRLKNIYPEYADRVGVLAVSYDPSSPVEEVKNELAKADWQWPAGQALGTMTRDYRVIISSIKVAFDSRGVIIYRGGFGEGSDDDWRQVFQNLAASR